MAEDQQAAVSPEQLQAREDEHIPGTSQQDVQNMKEENETEPAAAVVDQNGDAVAHNSSASQEVEQDYEHVSREESLQNVDNEQIPQKETDESHTEPASTSAPSPAPMPQPVAETPTPPPDTPRQRTDSTSTTATRSSARSTRSSMVFVVSALESIAASKDARKKKPLLDSTQRALSAIRSAQGDASQINPEIMFEPLNLATEASTVSVVTTALDCIGKLISYSYFSSPPSDSPNQVPEHQKVPLIERAIDTICDCFQGEATPAEVQMQIIKSLLAAILNDKIVVHGAGLLKSVRQTYNIFLLSKSSVITAIESSPIRCSVNIHHDGSNSFQPFARSDVMSSSS